MVNVVAIVAKYGEEKAETLMRTTIPWLEGRGMEVLVEAEFGTTGGRVAQKPKWPNGLTSSSSWGETARS